ncbi:MAG TPA: OmpH family outer membrane protein [Humisphaera sp.]|jgi:Skp family chaperone for outer membrane proteins|nr:OmpH family outer membrane protein [Humisphaera sp.]
MRVSRLFHVALLATLCSAMPAAAQNLKVATANPYRIYTQIKESADFQQKLEADKQKLVKEDNDKKMAINEKLSQRQQVKPDHPTFTVLSRQIEQASSEYKAWQETQNSELARQQKMKFLATYKKIEDAVGRVAEQEKIDLVLSTGPREFPTTVEGMNFNELEGLIGSRKIMYSKNIPDISEKVIALLDADYAKNPQQ